MTILAEGDCNFDSEDMAFLASVASDTFPWYVGKATKNFPCLTHNIMLRADDQSEGTPYSDFYDQALRMFGKLCERNNINVRTIYRMAFNLTFADPSKHGDPHIDHPSFAHKNLLIYLNQFDSGETFLFDDTGTDIVETIVPYMDKFAVFDGGWHAQGFCRPQQTRMVFVATFDGDVK